MERRTINPWTWQERFGFQQANEVTGAERVLYCAGQTSVDGNGNPTVPCFGAKNGLMQTTGEASVSP